MGPVPEGYHVAKSKYLRQLGDLAGFQVDGSPKPAVETTKKLVRVYPLSKKDNPPKMNFVHVSGKSFNTIHRMDFEIFNEINEVVQLEPSTQAESGDPRHPRLDRNQEGAGVCAGCAHEEDPRRSR